MQFIKRQGVLFVLLLSGIVASAQGEAAENLNDDAMRSNGKVYVVLAVVLTIVAGLIFYVVRLDKKISRLEKGKL